MVNPWSSEILLLLCFAVALLSALIFASFGGRALAAGRHQSSLLLLCCCFGASTLALVMAWNTFVEGNEYNAFSVLWGLIWKNFLVHLVAYIWVRRATSRSPSKLKLAGIGAMSVPLGFVAANVATSLLGGGLLIACLSGLFSCRT